MAKSTGLPEFKPSQADEWRMEKERALQKEIMEKAMAKAYGPNLTDTDAVKQKEMEKRYRLEAELEKAAAKSKESSSPQSALKPATITAAPTVEELSSAIRNAELEQAWNGVFLTSEQDREAKSMLEEFEKNPLITSMDSLVNPPSFKQRYPFMDLNDPFKISDEDFIGTKLSPSSQLFQHQKSRKLLEIIVPA